MSSIGAYRSCRVLLLCACACAAAAVSSGAAAKEALEPAREALRTLQFGRAVELLSAAAKSGDPEAEYLLALVYMNGVGVAQDTNRAAPLLRAAAERGHAAAAYVLAAELAHTDGAPTGAAQGWLDRSAKAGYPPAVEALRSHRLPLARETAGVSDPALLLAWVLDCARKDDAAELRRLGAPAVAVKDEFGRGALAYAVEAGRAPAAAALLELGADPRAADRIGTTPLMLAAQRPDAALTELLLQRGADPGAVDADRRTALFYAASADRPASVEALVRAGASVDALDARGYSALDAALIVEADAAAAALRSLNTRSRAPSGAIEHRGGKFDASRPGAIYRGWPPVALAAARDDTAGVARLLDAGADANARVPPGDPLLKVAADAHALGSLSLLLAHGADPAATDHAQHTTLWLMSARNDLAVLRALLEAGVAADAHAATEQRPLLAALRAARPDAAQLLLSSGANADLPDDEGHTPLMLAAAAGVAPVVATLIGRQAQIEARDRQGRTALWYAAASGSREAVERLLAAGANRSSADDGGLTPLHAAASQSHAEIVEALLNPDTLNRRSSVGESALIIAAANGQLPVVRALLAHAPSLDLQNNAGDTALIAASRGGHAGICHLLLAAGANRALRNGAGISAEDVASNRGFSVLAKEIAGKG
jgi:ankyrin repeat protein